MKRTIQRAWLATALLGLATLGACRGATSTQTSDDRSDVDAQEEVEVVDADTLQLDGDGGFDDGYYYYPEEPFQICPTTDCDAGYYRKRDSQVWFTFYDAASGGALGNKSFDFRILSLDSTRTIYRQTLFSNANGRVVSGKIANARGLPFKICLRETDPIFKGSTLYIRDYTGESGCYEGRLNPNDKDTINTHVSLTKASEVAVNLQELIRTGSYCPPSPVILTRDAIQLPGLLGLGLGSLGYCRNLDSQAYVAVVDDATGAQIGGARVDLTFDPAAGANTIIDTVYTTAGAQKFDAVSDKVSRMRGKQVHICARADNYASRCVDATAPAGGKDLVLVDGNALRLYPNKRPIGEVKAVGATTADGALLPGGSLVGWSVDPDHTHPVRIRVTTGGLERVIDTSLPNADACSVGGVCDRGDVGFSVAIDSLGLGYGRHALFVQALNVANGNQPAGETEYVLLNGAPLDVFIPPPPLGTLAVKSVGIRDAVVTLHRDDASANEGAAVRVCQGSTCRDVNVNLAAGAVDTDIPLGGLSPATIYRVSATSGIKGAPEITLSTQAAPPYELVPTAVARKTVSLQVIRANAAKAFTGKITFFGAPNKKGKRAAVAVAVKLKRGQAAAVIRIKNLRPALDYAFTLKAGGAAVATATLVTPP
jgi:hypothetical protein